MPSIKNVFFSAVHFLILVALFVAGGLCVGLNFNVDLRAFFLDKLTRVPDFFLNVGFLILGIGVLLTYAFYHLNKRSFFQVAMGPCQSTEVDVHVIEALSRAYFSTLYPEKEIPLEVVIHRKNKIELIVAFPELSEALLLEVEKELSAVFAKTLNYKNSFILTVT